MWNNGYALEELDYKSDNHLERSFPFISHIAKQYDVDIIASSVSNKKMIKSTILHFQ